MFFAKETRALISRTAGSSAIQWSWWDQGKVWEDFAHQHSRRNVMTLPQHNRNHSSNFQIRGQTSERSRSRPCHRVLESAMRSPGSVRSVCFRKRQSSRSGRPWRSAGRRNPATLLQEQVHLSSVNPALRHVII